MMSGWLEIIPSYTFTIDHRHGVLNMLPDALSRLYRTVTMQVSAKEASGPKPRRPPSATTSRIRTTNCHRQR